MSPPNRGPRTRTVSLSWPAALGLLVAGLMGDPGFADQPPVDRVIAAYYPPLMIEAGVPSQRISIDIVREANRRMGRATTLEFLPFRRALKTLRRRANVLQPALYRNPAERSRAFCKSIGEPIA